MRTRLTPDRIRRFTCPPGKQQAFLSDTEAPRLSVRVTCNGARSYVFEAKLNGRTIRITIGSPAHWDVETARIEAGRLSRLVDQGIDPRADAAERKTATEARRTAAERNAAPASEAWAAYIAERKAKWSARHIADHEAMTQEGGALRTRGRRSETDTVQSGALLALLSLSLAQIDAERVREWLRAEVAQRPTQAALAYRLLRAFLRWCSDRREWRSQIHADACAARLARDEMPTKRARDDCLQREQLKPWFAAVRAIRNPTIAAYLQTLLLTGARREELAALEWANVDFRWNSLHIADKVEEGGRTIPLTPYVAELLRGLKARNVRPLRLPPGEKWEPSPWAFTSPTAKSGRLTEPRLAHNRALAAAGIDGLTLHGLRRSFATLAEWVEAPAGVTAQIMGHKPSAIAEKHYRVRPLDLLRLWHARIEAWILHEAGIEPPKQEGGQAPALTSVSAVK